MKPLGPSRIELPYQRTFTASEAGRFRDGIWPQVMEQKWVIFLGDSSLDLWRSWTGVCIFSLPAQASDSGVIVGPLLVNGDTTQYRRKSDAEDIRFVESVINGILSWPASKQGLTPKCPKCGSIIYSRRNVLCGVCGERLPDELLFTPQEREAVERELQDLNDEEKKMREAEKQKSSDSGYVDFGGMAGV
jgi:hypothetical protein